MGRVYRCVERVRGTGVSGVGCNRGVVGGVDVQRLAY